MNDLKRITSLSVKFDKKRFYKQHIAVAMENNLFECAFELNLGLLELKISKKGKEEAICELKDIVRKVPDVFTGSPFAFRDKISSAKLKSCSRKRLRL